MRQAMRVPTACVHVQVKLLEGRGFGDTSVARFLEQAVEPPPTAAITNALCLLEAIGALEEGTERLTVRVDAFGRDSDRMQWCCRRSAGLQVAIGVVMEGLECRTVRVAWMHLGVTMTGCG